jgi:DNA-directed RNA polymerase subunit RPC12/RpoP
MTKAQQKYDENQIGYWGLKADDCAICKKRVLVKDYKEEDVRAICNECGDKFKNPRGYTTVPNAGC